MSYEDSPIPLRDAITPPPPPDTRWLQTPVRAFMRPGVVTVAEDASLLQVQRAMVAHGVHAVLITAAGGPLGWVTAAGLLPWLDKEPALYPARTAISEKVAYIPPGASARDALQALSDRRRQPSRGQPAHRRIAAGRRERDRPRPARLRGLIRSAPLRPADQSRWDAGRQRRSWRHAPA